MTNASDGAVTSDALDEHIGIVAALRARDSVAAQATMAEHIANSRERFRGRYAQ